MIISRWNINNGGNSINILFIYPQQLGYKLSPIDILKPSPHSPPLGILYLAKILENSAHKIEVVDYNAELFDKSKLERKIRSTDVVGITVNTPAVKITKDLLNFIKQIDKDKPVILGGPHCILNREKTLSEFNAEICVLSEAEFIIKRIINALLGKENLSEIPSIAYRDRDKILVNKKNEQIKNLDNIPFPARHLVEKYNYGYMLGEKIFEGKSYHHYRIKKGRL